MESIILKDIEYYSTNKKLFNKKYNNIIKRFIGRPVVGCCSYLYKKYAPISYQDFLDKYFADGDNNFNKESLRGEHDKGRNYESFCAIAQKYYEAIHAVNSNITYEQCFDDLITHTIIETFSGKDAERIVINKINGIEGHHAEETFGDLDAIYNVDIIDSNDEGHVLHYIQVKPFTTFKGNFNKSLISDRINFYHKEEKLNRDFPNKLGLEYFIYKRDKDGKIKFLTIDGKKRFTINQLCDRNGKTLIENIESQEYFEL